MGQTDKIREALARFVAADKIEAAVEAVSTAYDAEVFDGVEALGGVALLAKDGDRLEVTRASVLSLQLAANKAKKAAALKEPWQTLQAAGIPLDDKVIKALEGTKK